MTKWLFDRSLGVLIVLCTLCLSACAYKVHNWTHEDMTPKGTEEADNGKLLKNVRLDSLAAQPPNAGCDTNECFNLYYFKGDRFNTNDSGRKNVLFIVGGPGQIPQRTGEEFASFLERNHNLIYFDLRGSGLSPVPLSNTYDKYLRAKFAVGDIEQLRKDVLGNDGTWNAILGLSYGTVVAQLYAHTHATMVKRLILVAPVDRHDDTNSARKRIVFDNLDNIYNLIRSKDPHLCDCSTKPPLKVSFIPWPSTLPDVTEPTDNFCFLNPVSIKSVRDKLEPIYDKLERIYGSVNVVTQNLNELIRDATFQKDFPYPQEFFIALRQLQLLGTPSEQEDSIFFEEQIHSLVSAAMVVGYYSMLDETQPSQTLQGTDSPTCQINAPFFRSIGDSSVCTGEKGYCTRLNDTKPNLKPEKNGSIRALYVFGVYDGIYEWVFRVLNNKISKDTGCLKGKDIEDFAQGSEDEYGTLRKLARKIGNVPDDDVCPWNPGKFSHAVQTLILKGGADPVIGGCQAEDFFNNGLTDGNRVLIEFPAMGHVPFIRSKKDFLNPGAGETDQWKAYTEMLEKFLKLSPEEFRKAVNNELAILKAKDRTPQQGMRARCRG